MIHDSVIEGYKIRHHQGWEVIRQIGFGIYYLQLSLPLHVDADFDVDFESATKNDSIWDIEKL